MKKFLPGQISYFSYNVIDVNYCIYIIFPNFSIYLLKNPFINEFL